MVEKIIKNTKRRYFFTKITIRNNVGYHYIYVVKNIWNKIELYVDNLQDISKILLLKNKNTIFEERIFKKRTFVINENFIDL